MPLRNLPCLCGADVRPRHGPEALDLIGRAQVQSVGVLATGQARHPLRTRRCHRAGGLPPTPCGHDARKITDKSEGGGDHVAGVDVGVELCVDVDVGVHLSGNLPRVVATDGKFAPWH